MLDDEFLKQEEADAVIKLGFDKTTLPDLPPLYSQVFKWFRSHYKLSSHTDISYVNHSGESYYYQIINFADVIDSSTTIRKNGFKSIEEAELACLQKLIELMSIQLSKVVKDPDFSLLTPQWVDSTFSEIAEDIMNGELLENVRVEPDADGSCVIVRFDVNCLRSGLFRGHSIIVHRTGEISIDLWDTPIEGCGIEEELKEQITALLF